MTSERFFDIFAEINSKYVVEAREYPRRKKLSLVRWGSIAACLCVIISIVMVFQHYHHSTSNIIIKVNTVEDYILGSVDLDGTSYDGLSEEALFAVKNEFSAMMGIEYDEFVGCIPEKFELGYFYAVFNPSAVDGSSPRTLHDYCFTYLIGENKTIDIALCSFDKPLRDIIILEQSEHEISQIGDVTLVIYGADGYFWVDFEHQNINYYVKANGIDVDELEELLCGIILR